MQEYIIHTSIDMYNVLLVTAFAEVAGQVLVGYLHTLLDIRDVPRFVSGSYIMGFKSSKLVIIDFCAQAIPRIPSRHHVLYKAASKTKDFSTGQWVCSGSCFIWVMAGADYADHCGHISDRYVSIRV